MTDCPDCHGDGAAGTHPYAIEVGDPCLTCNGSGRVLTRIEGKQEMSVNRKHKPTGTTGPCTTCGRPMTDGIHDE